MSKLAEIKARWALGAPGPWMMHRDEVLSQAVRITVPVVAGGAFERYFVVARVEDGGEDDASKIAAAPDDVAWLLGRVEELEKAEQENMQKAVQVAHDLFHAPKETT